jgi:signal peptidase I
MRPAIPLGSLVLVHSVPISSLKVGDVITYINPLDPKTTLSHRIVKEYRVDGKIPAFVTKGDANKFDDVPITEGSVEGRVIWHIPDVGNWLLDVKQPIVILPVIWAASLLIMGDEVIRLRDYLRSQQPYILAGYKRKENDSSGINKRLALGFSLFAALILIIAGTGPSVFALLKSNTVVLADNRLTISVPSTCSGNTNNNNTVVFTNNNGQTSTTGNASSSGGNGSATSGNSTNNSSTSVTITLSNC